MYDVRRVKIGTSPHLDALAHACGQLYSQALVFFWRTVRHKGIWLKPKHLMRLFTSDQLHAHTSDATVQAFCAALHSWRKVRKVNPQARPPHKRKWYFRIEYKQSVMRLDAGQLWLSNGKGNAPLIIPWSWEMPKTLVVRWTGSEYEALATYQQNVYGPFPPGETAGIDLGEIHMAVSHDGAHTHILNGRALRSKRQYQNKLKARLCAKIDTKKKGSRRRRRLIASKKRQLTTLRNQVKDIEHKQTSALIATLHEEGVARLVIGDVRQIRQALDVGPKNNQKLHQWSHGTTRHLLTYKAERRGMDVVLQEESYTSRTCPACGKRRKSKVQGRVFRCPAVGTRDTGTWWAR